MGLDITAYSKIKPTKKDPEDNWETVFVACVHPHFPGRADDIENGEAYEFKKSFKFGAGSYSGFNAWREDLARMAGYPAIADPTRERHPEKRHDEGAWAAKDGPFWELINFADNEGIIGAKTSAKLAKDFADFHAQADEKEEWFKELYRRFRKAFELASDGGAVDFH